MPATQYAGPKLGPPWVFNGSKDGPKKLIWFTTRLGASGTLAGEAGPAIGLE